MFDEYLIALHGESTCITFPPKQHHATIVALSILTRQTSQTKSAVFQRNYFRCSIFFIFRLLSITYQRYMNHENCDEDDGGISIDRNMAATK